MLTLEAAGDLDGRLPLSDISESIQAKHLATPLARGVTVGPRDRLRDVLPVMRAAQFDFVPVVEGGEALGLLPVTACPPEDMVIDGMRPLDAHMLVSSDTPLVDVASFSWMSHSCSSCTGGPSRVS